MVNICTNTYLDYNNVLIQPRPSTIASRSNVNLKRSIKFKNSHAEWSGVPIIAANMDTVGTFEVYNVLQKFNIITALHKFYTIDDYISANNKYDLDPDLYMISTGISSENYDNLCNIMKVVNCNWICIDIANGYLSTLTTFCKSVREIFPNKKIVAGNVATPELVEKLLTEGLVDVVKIGIGPGSACTTRLKTGVGVPQLSAVIECAKIAHKYNGHIIADGGITCPGDVSKAFCAGADFVMMGGRFAGHDENPGNIIEENGKKFKQFYGMSSTKAMITHYGKKQSYRSSEGRELKIPYKGSLVETVEDYLGGVRSTCTYINAKSIKDMENCTTFIITGQQVNKVFV